MQTSGLLEMRPELEAGNVSAHIVLAHDATTGLAVQWLSSEPELAVKRTHNKASTKVTKACNTHLSNMRFI